MKWDLILSLATGLLGGILLWVTPDHRAGYFLVNAFLFQCFLLGTILPHELGHALMAHLVGMRVFRIMIGQGNTMYRGTWFGVDIELKPLWVGGLVFATVKTLRGLRWRLWCFTLAGPLVNLVLVAAIWPFLEAFDDGVISMLLSGLHPAYLFLFANLLVLATNLWPRNLATAMGYQPSDGKALLKIPFLSREEQQFYHVNYFIMEALQHLEKKALQGGLEWVEKGLALYSDHLHLINLKGMIFLEMGAFDHARSCFLNLLQRDHALPTARPLLLNNVAYADVLIGGESLLAEADLYSQEAMKDLQWMPAVRGTRGAVLTRIGEVDAGIAMLHDSMAGSDTASAKAQNACLIAEAEWRRGHQEVARKYEKEARKLDPACNLLKRFEALTAGS